MSAVRPSVAGAYDLARRRATARMQKAGRARPDAGDEVYIRAELARLLLMVDGGDGGLLGLSDTQCERRCEELGLAMEYVSQAMWVAGQAGTNNLCYECREHG